eukprot:COSAG02_NODE_14284_length_1290_cov_0.893367_1_plen_37_part_10
MPHGQMLVSIQAFMSSKSSPLLLPTSSAHNDQLLGNP